MQTLTEVLAKYQTHPEFLGIALERADQRGAVDDTPLHIAARKGEVDDIRVLVAHGANVNCVGDLGNTPLHQAAMAGSEDAAQLLLSLGADRTLKNEFGETPQHVAQQAGNQSIAALLLKTRR